MMLTLLTVLALYVFAYHYERNGNPWSFTGDTVPRLLWGTSVAVGYLFLSLPHTNFLAMPWLVVSAFSAVAFVPHGYCMNMGRWGTPQKKWPSFFLSAITDADWVAMPMWKRTGYDALSMASIGLIRGLMVFPVLCALGFSAWHVALAVLVQMLWHPFSYFAGFYVPFNIWNNTAKSPTWGEFFVGVGWFLSMWTVTGWAVSWL